MRLALFVLIVWLVAAILGGCSVVDGLHQFRSGKFVPAYPAYIADEPCIWREGGKVYLIDRKGVHELK